VALAPMRYCPERGCGTLTRGGPCASHVKARDVRRGTSTARGYDSRWARYSRAFRAEYPVCGMRPSGATATSDSLCRASGRVSPAECVDHIVPIIGSDDPRFYDATNHQALCDSCHAVKRAREAQDARAR
jgi:5-methylcytosine-specific restriction protein A